MKLSQRFPLYKHASLCLVGLACFFFWSYGLAIRYTASLEIVPSIPYSWEKYIPFIPWMIIPYWSMDLFYGLSFFLCTTKRELAVHAGRLFAASCICCTYFMVFPLACSAEIPFISNWFFHFLFKGLSFVDAPYNQAPSLHIVLAWLVWLRFRAHTKGWKRLLVDSLFLLIGVSVLTCYQHHFIDVVLGLAVGVCISYLLPMRSYPRFAGETDPKRWKLGGFYVAGSILLAGSAWFLGAWGWFLLWPAASLLVVGLGYWIWGPAVFQKDEQGLQSLSARILLAPYLWGAALSQRYFMRRIPAVSQITDRLYVGRLPYAREACAERVVDLTAEFDSSDVAYRCKTVYPCLDLLALPPAQLQQAVELLKTQVSLGPTIVCCALGLSRSAAVAAAYLMAANKVLSVQEAAAYIGKKRPQIIFSNLQIQYLLEWKKDYIYINKEEEQKYGRRL